VTGDEALGLFLNVKTKEQSKEWTHTHSPNKLEKFIQTSAGKLTATVFRAKKGVLLVGFMHQWTTIASEVCFEAQNCIGPFREKSMEF
jgi:hypothetical protein